MSPDAVILADSILTGGRDIQNGVIIRPNEGDSAAGLSSGSLNIPMLKRSDGSVVSERQVVSTSVPVSASEDGGRDIPKANRSIASGSSGSSSRQLADSRGGASAGQKRSSLMKRSSFFGVRGGQGKTTKR